MEFLGYVYIKAQTLLNAKPFFCVIDPFNDCDKLSRKLPAFLSAVLHRGYSSRSSRKLFCKHRFSQTTKENPNDSTL
jgi:hypothetical protein